MADRNAELISRGCLELELTYAEGRLPKEERIGNHLGEPLPLEVRGTNLPLFLYVSKSALLTQRIT